jgi:16S rRNA processing protein RimM
MAEPTVVVGRITRVHGLRGEVSVQVLSDNPDRFVDGAHVFLEDGAELVVHSARPNGSRLLVAFEGVADRTAAEALRGKTLVVPESLLPALPEGEYWPHELQGCEVITETGRELGIVRDVVPNPANDLWVAVDERGAETLLPAIRQVIVEVDLESKRILVRDIPGLTAPES